jgi:hypothetical protein
MNTSSTSISVLALTLSLFACATESNDEAAPVTTVDMGLVSACEGAYTCAYGSKKASTKLERIGDQCYAGKLALNADGSTAQGVRWSGDRNQFSLCDGSECVTCSNDAKVAGSTPLPAPAMPRDSKKCKGSRSCNSSPPCGGSGCYMHTHYRYDGHGNVSGTEYSCLGSPSTSCSEASSEDYCRQLGCRWE